MLKRIKNVVHSVIREHLVKNIIHPIIGKRSSKWPSVRKAFLKENPICAACGGTWLLNVHHKMPFHLKPALELSHSNLITLCMGKFECHLKLGHGDNWSSYNPAVETFAKLVRKDPSKRNMVEEKAYNLRKF